MQASFFARSTLTLALALSSAAAARAAETTDEESPPSDDSSASEGEEKPASSNKADDAKEAKSGAASYGHGRQFGLRVALTGGYRMVLRYEKSPLCRDYQPEKGNDQAKFCGFGAPLAIDLALSGALIDAFEPFVWARFGLVSEERTNTKPLVLVGAGARIYTMSDSAFKIYVEPALGFELEGKGDSSNAFRILEPSNRYRTDLLFHLAAGPQFDLAKNFGFYLDAGLTLGILRYLQSTLEIKAGIQGRLP